MDDIDLEALQGISRRGVLKAAAFGGAGMAAMGMLAACSSSGGKASGASAGATGSTGSKTKSYKFMDHLIANVPAFESTDAAFKASAKALGSTSSFTSHDGDTQKALSQELTFPSLGIQGVFTYLVSDGSIPQYAKNLTDKGVTVANISNRLAWFDPSDPKFNGKFAGIAQGPFAEEAYIICKALFEAGGGKGKAIRLRGPKGGLSDGERGFGADLALKEYPGVEVVGTAYTDWDPTKGQKALEALLPQYPDVKFIMTMNDGLAMGALATLKAARNTTALIMGCDGDPDFLEAMAKEERLVATSAGLIAFSGVLAATRLYDSLSGVQFNPLEAYIDTDSVIVDTKEAAAELLKLTGPGAPLLWDARKMSRAISGDNWITQHNIQVGNPASFEWGDKPGTNKTPRPANFKFNNAYQKALDAGGIDTVNADWAKRFQDPYGAVRAAAKHKTGALGEFKRQEII